MKIAFIEPAGKGGMIHYVFQLCRALDAAGADVTLITSCDYELAALPHSFRIENSIDLWDPKPAGELSTSLPARAWRKVRRVGRAIRYYTEWFRAIRRATANRPDVVLLGDIRFAADLVPLMFLRRKARILADICHNVRPFSAGGASGGLFARSKWLERIYKRIYALFDVVFVHFDRNRAEFASSFHDRVGVIVHGNEEIFREIRNPVVTADALRTRLEIRAGEPVVLFFGVLSRYKGIDVLLEAFPAVHESTGARLVLCGFPFHDFDVAAHQARAKDLGIADAVSWVPQYIATDEVAGWMDLATAIVFPYRDIYQSGALHVAQAFGVPTVASDVGAFREVLINEESGLLVPPENPPALAAALTRLLQDRDLASRLSARFSASARGRFSWSSIAQTMVNTLGDRQRQKRGLSLADSAGRREESTQ